MRKEYEKTTFYREENTRDRVDLKLVIVDGRDEPKEVFLEEIRKKDITFGRNTDNDIVLKSRFVSRYHGVLHIDKGHVIVEDRGSKNLLIINGNLIKKSILREGDVLRIDQYQENKTEGVMFFLASAGKRAAWNILPLKGRQEILIGRNELCDITLNHVGVSKFHADMLFSTLDDAFLFRLNDGIPTGCCSFNAD